jgi:pyruvate/2-oxoglutarate dehydrogenase complex dihydrolipoamide dehydrogenase (E3) component
MQRLNPDAPPGLKSGATPETTPGGFTRGTPLTPDICVIGAGSGGLSVAAAAAAFGQKVVLIEKHKMGGDCLNFGCVPSKALIASAKRAHAMRTSQPFGIAPVEPTIDKAKVRSHVREVIATIAPNDSVERFTGLGVHVIQAAARFVDATTVVAGEHVVKARRFVIATGSSPMVPPIPGLAAVPYLTNETLFDVAEPMPHLIIIGAGPIGLEMAQAHRRLGSAVTVLDAGRPLAKDDPELTEIVLRALKDEGVVIRDGIKVTAVEGTAGAIRVMIATEKGGPETISGTHILVAAGRKANIGELGLEAAKITSTKAGITVDAGMVTSNGKVFAIGDCAGGLQFTHAANDQAGIVIRRVLFRLPAKHVPARVPWVTYTQPELAHIGLTEAEADKQYTGIKVLRWPYHENDRAQAERETEGHVKVVVSRKGKILGASIVGAHAGELIQMWSLAVSQNLDIKAMTGFVSPYPTLSEINKRAAVRYYASAAGNALVRKAISLLKSFG